MDSEGHRLIVTSNGANAVGDVIGRDGSVGIDDEDVGGGQIAEGGGVGDSDEVLVNRRGGVAVPGDAKGGDASDIGELDVDGSVGVGFGVDVPDTDLDGVVTRAVRNEGELVAELLSETAGGDKLFFLVTVGASGVLDEVTSSVFVVTVILVNDLDDLGFVVREGKTSSTIGNIVSEVVIDVVGEHVDIFIALVGDHVRAVDPADIAEDALPNAGATVLESGEGDGGVFSVH